MRWVMTFSVALRERLASQRTAGLRFEYWRLISVTRCFEKRKSSLFQRGPSLADTFALASFQRQQPNRCRLPFAEKKSLTCELFLRQNTAQGRFSVHSCPSTRCWESVAHRAGTMEARKSSKGETAGGREAAQRASAYCQKSLCVYIYIYIFNSLVFVCFVVPNKT